MRALTWFFGATAAFVLASVVINEQVAARCNDTNTKIVATYANLFESKTWLRTNEIDR